MFLSVEVTWVEAARAGAATVGGADRPRAGGWWNRADGHDVPLHMNTLRHHRLTAATLAVALLAAACGGIDVGDAPTDDELVGEWELTAGTGPAGEIVLVDGYPITLSIGEDEAWGGTAACNAYGSDVTVDGPRVEITEVFQTEMACVEDGVMEAEAAYLDAYRRATSVEVDGDVLVLRGDAVELTFQRRPPEPEAYVPGTVWQVVSLLEGTGPDGAASEARGGASLVLHDDGTLALDTGCTEHLGTYTFDEETLLVEQLSGDVTACDEPLGPQQDHILRIFDGPVHVEHEGLALRLTNPAEGIGLDLRADV